MLYVLSCKDGGRSEGLKIQDDFNTRSLEGTGFALLCNDLAKSGDARARAVLNVTKLSRLNVRKL